MDNNPQSRHFGGAVFAVLLSLVAASLTGILVTAASVPAGMAFHRLRLVSDEGAAWFGISVGIPLGVLCAVIMFAYCFKKIRPA